MKCGEKGDGFLIALHPDASCCASGADVVKKSFSAGGLVSKVLNAEKR